MTTYTAKHNERRTMQPRGSAVGGVRQLFGQGRNPFLIPMSELDAMIAAGWGGTARINIPPDWRERPKATRKHR